MDIFLFFRHVQFNPRGGFKATETHTGDLPALVMPIIKPLLRPLNLLPILYQSESQFFIKIQLAPID